MDRACAATVEVVEEVGVVEEGEPCGRWWGGGRVQLTRD